jgi:hypothetical protein
MLIKRLRTNDFTIILLLGVLSIIGIKVLLFTTAWGIGLSPDSTQYIGAARNLLNGKGLSITSPSRDMIPMTHYPPLYPTMIALTGIFSIDPLTGARWLNVLLFGTNIMLVGLVIYKYTFKSIWPALFGSLFVLSSFDMIYIHSMAWSEPLFITFCILGLLTLGKYIDNPRPILLVTSSVVISMGFLARYVGISLISAGTAGILLLNEEKYYKRIINSFTFFVISCFPMALWFIRNLYVGGTMTNRKMAFHPVTYRNLKIGLYTISKWIFPASFPGILGAIILLTLVTTLVILNIIILSNEKNKWGGQLNKKDITKFPHLLALFTLFHLGLLIVSISFFDAHTPLNLRTLSPVYVIVLILVFCQANKLLAYQRSRRLLQATSIIICIAIIGIYLSQNTTRISKFNRTGLGYASRFWKQSQIIQKVKDLPSEIEIYSNGPDAIYILTGKPAYFIPSKVDPGTRLVNKNYLSELSRMREQLKHKKGVIVYFYVGRRRWYLPSIYELKSILQLKLLIHGTDGAIYEIDS